MPRQILNACYSLNGSYSYKHVPITDLAHLRMDEQSIVMNGQLSMYVKG